jgi:hypothetical protein
MNIGRWAALFPFGLLPLFGSVLTSCGPPGAYVPPPTPPTSSFSRELPASFDQAWSAITNVAGATFFSIKNFDKASGLMTLDYSDLKVANAYIECGTMSGGMPLVSFPATRPNAVQNYMLISGLTLAGTGNITLRAVGPKRTQIQINSLYRLRAFRRTDQGNVVVSEWKFTTRDADSEMAPVDFRNTQVTCRPSYKLEEEFLTEVEARL